MGQIFGVHTLDSYAICRCSRFQCGGPTSCGRLAGCRAVAKMLTLLCQRWSTHALQVVGELFD